MLGAPVLAALALFASASDLKNPALVEGIRLYDALDYAGALQSLTAALGKPSSKRDLARIHLYIGLIQHRFKLVKDAEASFTKALDYDPKVKLPKASTPAAKVLFKRIQKVKGVDDASEARAEAERKKRNRSKKREGEGDDSQGIEYMSSSPATHTSSAASDPPRDESDGDPRVASTKSGNGALAMNGGSSSKQPGGELPGVRATPREGDALAPQSGSVVQRESSSGTPIAGWIAVGVGVAAVATGVTLGALAAKNGSDAITEPVASRAEELHATAVEQRTIAFVSFGVSGAALGLAALLFLTE